MTLIVLTVLLGALLLVANEYELRKRKERRRLECQEAINTLEYRLGLRWDQHDQRVEHGAGTIDLRGGIAPGVAIPVDGSPQDFFMRYIDYAEQRGALVLVATNDHHRRAA